jgi:protein-tyrosine phosphatase
LAEALFRQAVIDQGLGLVYEADSCGTNRYHTGELPDPRTRTHAATYGLVLTHRARTLSKHDFEVFDALYVMDRQNLTEVRALAPTAELRAKVELLRTYDPEPGDGQVPDPYYGTLADFEVVYQILKRATAGLLGHLERSR